MPRVLLECRGVAVHAYPAMLSLGLVLGTIAGNYVAHFSGMEPLRVYAATLLLAGPALIGARLLFVASHWPVYRSDRARIWRRSDGGAAVYGGLFVTLAISVPLLRLLGLPFWAFWDVAIFTILVGLAFGKIGCLLHGCCAGRPIAGFPGLRLADHRGVRVRRIPSQILEAAWAVVVVAGINALRGRVPFEGALFLCGVGGYGVGRALLESTRERIDRIGGVSLNRSISGALAIGSGAVLLGLWMAAGTPR